MKFIADFHIHSKYSIATSKDMDFENISQWAKWKGINLVGTGDFTHPLWFNEIKRKLKPCDNGLFDFNGTKFILSTEVCNVFQFNGKTKKIHNMIFAPSLSVASKINKEFSRYCDLVQDGRPLLNMTVKKMTEIVLSASNDCVIIPCHIWTPHFSLFGANSGFDSLKECFEEYSSYIFAVETGLSSDPEMNWIVEELNDIALVSNSDAHSPSKLGREANIFDTEMSYNAIFSALRNLDKTKFLGTIEFFPQEGKYYYDGHRSCGISFNPLQSKKNKNLCPKCKKPLTIGVLNRIKQLSKNNKQKKENKNRFPFKRIIPLIEIIAEAYRKNIDSSFVRDEYLKSIFSCGNELDILLNKDIDFLLNRMNPLVVEGIIRAREGKVNIECGYDGMYGRISLFSDKEVAKTLKQETLF